MDFATEFMHKHLVLCVSAEYRRNKRKGFPLREIPLSAEIRIPPEHLSSKLYSSIETQSPAGASLIFRQSHLTRK
jgi:hypothetical protein